MIPVTTFDLDKCYCCEDYRDSDKHCSECCAKGSYMVDRDHLQMLIDTISTAKPLAADEPCQNVCMHEACGFARMLKRFESL